MKKDLRIAFCGGGSGGHVYPLLAVAEKVKDILSKDVRIPFEFYYFGDSGMYAKNFTDAGMKMKNITSFKIRRYFSLLNIIDVIKLPFAFVQAFLKMFSVMPDVLFSKGGTGSIPVVLAAWFFRVPVFIHESDSIPGLSNSISFGFSKRVAVSFSKTLEKLKGEKTALVGNPLRSFLLEDDEEGLTKEKAKKIFGFDPETPLVLVLGGSQGAVRINDFMLDNAKDFITRCQVLHQTGVDNFSDFKNELALATEGFIPEQRARYKIVDFFQKEIKEAMIAADIIISRSGSGAIFEIAYFKKPSILIPLKESARNHQFFNAYEYAQRGACIIIEEDNLKSTLFFVQLDNLLKDKIKYQEMEKRAGQFAKPLAADMIAQEIVRMILG